MPTELKELAAYRDDQGNEIRFTGHIDTDVTIRFAGSNNTLVVGDKVRFGKLTINFDCDNGVVSIGESAGVPRLSASMRVGQDSVVRIGKNVSSTGPVTISVAEGATIDIGDDVMFASLNHVRADDGHPIFDVKSGRRVNPSQSITIGSHVWLAFGVVVLGGAEVGDGSVVGINSVVTRKIPNNCVAVGTPAKVVRKNVAWERPHLTISKPYYKPDASTVKKTRKYWRLTEADEPAPAPAPAPVVVPTRTLWQRIRGRLAREVRRRMAARR